MIVVALALLVISWVSTYMASFGLSSLSVGTLSPTPPQEPLSFVRAVDPSADSVLDIESEGDLVDQLGTPGMAVAIDHMRSDPRLFLVLPLNAATSKIGAFSGPLPTTGSVVVGSRPPFLPTVSAAAGNAPLWGPVPEVAISGRIGPVAVQPVDPHPLVVWYVAGSGYREKTGRGPLLWLAPDDAAALGFYFPYSAATIANALTCYCGAGELAVLTSRMTSAEHSAETGRTFYAVEYSAIVGPSERSGAARAVLLTLFPIAVAGTVVIFAGGALRLLWRLRRYDYEVERRSGAAELYLQVRQQVVVFLATTLPLAMGFVLADAIVQSTEPPPPWPPLGGVVGVVAVVALQVTAGLPAFISVHQICRPWGKGAHD